MPDNLVYADKTRKFFYVRAYDNDNHPWIQIKGEEDLEQAKLSPTHWRVNHVCKKITCFGEIKVGQIFTMRLESHCICVKLNESQALCIKDKDTNRLGIWIFNYFHAIRKVSIR